MLRITLDEAYVFDLVSIYEVKIEKSTGEKKNKLMDSYRILVNEIIEQIGLSLFSNILSSEVYKQLKEVNAKVFDLVDRAGESELSKITADANYERFIKKTELQDAFFRNKLTEVKI